MWNKKRSIMLSKVFVLLFIAGLCAVCIGAPWVVRELQYFSYHARQVPPVAFLVTVYTGSVPAGVLLYSLYRLLCNIGVGVLFSEPNIAHMRRISWCCFLGGGICLASAFYYLPWAAVAIAAAFVGLIVRIVKNVVAEGVLIKEENDFTI